MMANEERIDDEVFAARVALGLRELDGVERCPDVSDEVSRQLALHAPRGARSPWRWLTAVAALLAIAVTTTVLVQHKLGSRGNGDKTSARSTQDPVSASGKYRYVYEFPADELQRAAAGKPGQDTESMMAAAVTCLQRRVGSLAKVARGEGTTVTVVFTASSHEEINKVTALIEAELDLQMRIVADGDYVNGQVRFHLPRERQKLRAWLALPGNKELLYKDPRYIRNFNDDTSGGPEPFGKLAWYPRLIVPTAGGERWGHSCADMPVLAAATVQAFDDSEYANGVTAAMQQKPEAERFLVELIALNMDERHFTGADLDPASISVASNPGFGINYRVVDARAAEYSDWSEKYIGRCCAIVIDGVVRTAPRFESRIPSRGQINGLSREDATSIARLLALPLVVQPELQSREVGPR